MSIELSKIASEQVKSIVSEQNLEEEKTYLRVGVKGGGCSGFSYVLDLTDNYSEEEDWLFESEGIKIACDQKSHIYLNGTNIDYQEGLMGRGFVFNNPNATSVCGCQASFSV